MTPDDVFERVREENDTALSRLGSSKSLYAATGGEMETENVLRAAADAEYAAYETFQEWADTSEGVAQDFYRETADEEASHYDRVVAELDDHVPSDEVSAMHEHLRTIDDPIERAGGYVGRLLATRASKEQYVGFFVGQADPQTAQLFRDLKSDLDDQDVRARDLLDATCDTAEDYQRAIDTATEVVQAAYDEYTAQLDSLGVNPKPVC
ncbi:rubrerythrin family protein [Salarchaeum sp. JOR-1]|uniref:rubrerythrin family protein n=1 Tax=Salarchaeum sp. JOR-1 TaxID=2599399 RepID=UPI0011987AD6|nr:rubrerythrin family protein [Salarchaeum sp. JOR-1]QDX40171.1 rubrerythrin family protein [Salarchaeum sp. JOR-1]